MESVFFGGFVTESFFGVLSATGSLPQDANRATTIANNAQRIDMRQRYVLVAAAVAEAVVA